MNLADIRDSELLDAVHAGYDTVALLAHYFNVDNPGAVQTRVDALVSRGYLTAGTPGAGAASRLHLTSRC